MKDNSILFWNYKQTTATTTIFFLFRREMKFSA